MSIRDYNKPLKMVVQDCVTNEFKTFRIDDDFSDETLYHILKDITKDNIKNRIPFKVDFLICS